MDLGEAAAAFRGIADRAKSELAMVACEEAAKDYLAILRIVTPKRTGALADSEHIDAVFGGGEHATAVIAPHKVYAAFRNDGGTITRKLPPPHVLGNPSVGFFGHSVTQAGSHYMERANGLAKGPVAIACQRAADAFFTL